MIAIDAARLQIMNGRIQDQQMVAAYLEHLRRAGCTDDTITLRRKILTNLDRALVNGLGDTDADELGAWLHRKTWSRGTRATYCTGLRSFYRWASDPRQARPWVDVDPMPFVETITAQRGVARPFTDEQLADILARAAEPYRTWTVLAAYNGLRCIEIARLERKHVTAQQLVVVKGKGGWPRVHDTDPYVWDAVRDLPDGPIARKENGEQASANYVTHMAARHFRQLGYERLGLHGARHWLGVNTQREYKDVRVTMAVLGHRSLSSTQIYTDATMDQQRAARASLPRLAG